MTQSQRALAIMTKTQIEQRSSARKSLHRSAKVTCESVGCADQIALIRDVSGDGIFFYCKIKPTVGAPLTVVFNMPVENKNFRVTFTGRVVRVEKCEGTLFGMAARLDGDASTAHPAQINEA